MRVAALLIVTLSLASCAYPSTTMSDDQGRVAVCSSGGWGAIGTAAALITYGNCVDQA